jgi:predicted transcriptional regulator
LRNFSIAKVVKFQVIGIAKTPNITGFERYRIRASLAREPLHDVAELSKLSKTGGV